MIFRFDDVSIRSDMKNTDAVADVLTKHFPGCEIIYAVNPAVAGLEGERVFPKIWNTHSDYRQFYQITQVGLPMIRHGVTIANHGLIHIDHRLLSKEAQEMSILTGCSLVNSKIFVPPFNKWNKDTENVCEENDIELVRFEYGVRGIKKSGDNYVVTGKSSFSLIKGAEVKSWLCMEHNKFIKDQTAWYLHAREWTPEKVEQWIGAAQE